MKVPLWVDISAEIMRDIHWKNYHYKITSVGVGSNHLFLLFQLLREMMDFTSSYSRINLLLIIFATTVLTAYCLKLP